MRPGDDSGRCDDVHSGRYLVKCIKYDIEDVAVSIILVHNQIARSDE